MGLSNIQEIGGGGIAQVFRVKFHRIFEVYILNLTRGDFCRAYYRRRGIIIQYKINQNPSIIHDLRLVKILALFMI